MADYDIKEMVKDNKKVFFESFDGTNLLYKTENGFTFPVPLKESGTASFLKEDRAMLFMRYIKKQIEKEKENKESLNRRVIFEFYKENEMWYKTENGFLFPVPVDELLAVDNFKNPLETYFSGHILNYKEILEKAKHE